MNAGIDIISNTAKKKKNTNLKVTVSGNNIKCNGQPINIQFQHSKDIASNRSYEIIDNMIEPLKSVDYGIFVSPGSGNNDSLVYEGELSKDVFNKNIVYSSVANVNSSKMNVITRKK